MNGEGRSSVPEVSDLRPEPNDHPRTAGAHGPGAFDDRFYFRQLLAGRDFAVGDPVATQMVNFAYLIGDRVRGECVVVDPAYAV